MSSKPRWWRQAQAQGLLPADASATPAQPSPSWTVMGLSFAGAQLVLWPFLAFLLALAWDALLKPPGVFVTALGFALVAVWLLRRPSSLFRAQIGFNLSLVAQGLWVLGWVVDWDVPLHLPMLASLLGLQLGMAVAIRVLWVQRLLGAMACWVALTLPMPWGQAQQLASVWTLTHHWPHTLWLLALVGGWVAWVATQPRSLTQRWAPAANAVMEGVAVGLLLALAVQDSMAWVLLDGAAPGSADAAHAGSQLLWRWGGQQAVQLALVLAAGLWLWWHWRPQGRALALVALVYGVLALACLAVPGLGGLALVASTAITSGRRRLLWLALAVLLLGLGHFYYALQWPLQHKAALLAALGLGLTLAMLALRQPGGADGRTSAPAPRRPVWVPLLLVLATALALGVVHQDVQRKEQVIAHGQKIYLPLAPVDPRSLLQGDYMALNFALPQTMQAELKQRQAAQPGLHRVLALAQRDARGVTKLLTLAEPGQPLGQDQLLVPLQRLKGRWVVATDAFFFPEGQGRPLAGARFGEFRVLPDGRALLVGLADGHLQALEPGQGEARAAVPGAVLEAVPGGGRVGP